MENWETIRRVLVLFSASFTIAPEGLFSGAFFLRRGRENMMAKGFKNELGSTLIEFAFSMIIFMSFTYGLFAVSWWGIGAEFVQQAAHEAATKYAVTIDDSAAEQRAVQCLGKWAYLFIKPGSVEVDVWKEGDAAHALISAEPTITKLYLYSLPRIEKTSSCIFEYRFRNPEKFVH